MSLLTICTRVADHCSVPRPAAVITAADPTGRRLLTCAREEIRQLVTRGDWQELQRQAAFNLVDGQADYPLSAIAVDLGRIINGSEWNRTFRRPMDGPLSAQERQAIKAWNVLPSIRRKFWVVGNTLTIWPTPASNNGGAGDAIALEYVSKFPVASAAGVAQFDWQADSDVGLLDEYLIELGVRWRFLKSVGLAYQDAEAQYEQEVTRRLAQGSGAPVLSLNGTGELSGLGDPFGGDGGRDAVNWSTITIPAGQL